MACGDGRLGNLTAKATIFRFIIGPLTDVMESVFQAFYSCPEMGSNDGKMTLREYQKNNGISNKRMCSIFGKMADSLMDVNLMTVEQDISFYYAAITQLNEPFFSKIDLTSKKLMKEIKDHRNKFCHNKTFNTQLLKEKLESLENLCFELLKVFEEKNFPLNSYILDGQRNVKSLITQLKDEPASIDVYQQQRDEFFAELRRKLISEGRKELSRKRGFGCSTDPFSKLIKLHCQYDKDQPIEDVFTPPWIQYGQLKVSYDLLLSTPNNDGKVPRVVFICGLGGSGKSVLTQIISAEWQSNKTLIKHLDKFNFVFKVELKHTCCKTLQDLLCKELLVETMKLGEWEDVFPLMHSLKILFLVDGFDEVKEKNKSLVKDIACLLPDSRILLTTRPEYIQEAQNEYFQSSSSLTLDLHGFDVNDRKVFALNVLKLTEYSGDEQQLMHHRFCQFLDTRSHVLQTHLKLPLTVALLIFLWLEYQDDVAKLEAINTATQLHRELFLMLKEKLITKRPLFVNVSDEVHDCILLHLQGKALEQLVKNIFLQLSDESYEAVKDNCSKYQLHEKQLTEFLSAYLVFESDVAQEPKKKKKKTTNPKPVFAFFHKVQMEYFGAEHVVSELKEKGNSCLKNCLPSVDERRYKEVLPFIAGRLSFDGLLENYAVEFVRLSQETGVQETDFNYWFMLMSETARQDPRFRDLTYNEIFCRHVADKLPKRLWQLKTETLKAGLNLLILCETIRITEMEIDFRINDDPNDIQDLKVILQRASVALGKRFGEHKIDLSLHIRSHRMNYTEDRTDLYCQYFLSWTRIVKFTGHLGPAAVQHLSACKMIDVKLTSLDGFNSFMKQWQKFRKLKQLTISANFMESLAKRLVRHIPPDWKCEFRILFHGVTSRSLDHVISFVETCARKGNFFTRLGVHTSSLGYDDGVRLFGTLQDLVIGKVTVESPGTHLTDEQERTIMTKALSHRGRPSTFQAEWNNREVVA